MNTRFRSVRRTLTLLLPPLHRAVPGDAPTAFNKGSPATPVNSKRLRPAALARPG